MVSIVVLSITSSLRSPRLSVSKRSLRSSSAMHFSYFPKLQSQFQSLWDNGETFARGVIKDRRETPDLIPGRPPLTRYIIEFDLEECMKRVKK